MSVNSFKPTLWEKGLLVQFTSASVIDLLTTAPTELKGEKVVWNALTPAEWKDYVKGTKINWAEISTNAIEMSFDRQQSFAVMLDNVDRVQLGANAESLIATLMKNQGDILAENIDIEVINAIITNTDASNTLGSDKPIALTSANAYDTIVDLCILLSKKKVPITNRTVTITNDVLALLEKDERFTKNYEVLENGIVDGAKINGATLIVREGFTENTILANHPSSTGYGMQLSDIKAVELDDYFADGIKGLCSYAKAQLRKESSAVAKITIGTAS